MKPIANPTLDQLYQTTERWFSDKLVDFAELLTEHLVVKAEQSTVTSVQSQCFTAIQSIRTTGSRSIPLFTASLKKHFQTNSIKPNINDDLFNISHGRKNPLDLLTTKDLEDSLSYETAIEKLHKKNKEAFEHLEVRIYELLKQTHESIEQNPLSAETIITAFRDSLDLFDFTPEIRIEVYKLFVKFMNSELPELLTLLNEQLIDAGILPEIDPDYFIKKLARHNNSTGSAPPVAEEPPKPEQPSVTNEFSQNPYHTTYPPSDISPQSGMRDIQSTPGEQAQVTPNPGYATTRTGSPAGTQQNLTSRLMDLANRLSQPGAAVAQPGSVPPATQTRTPSPVPPLQTPVQPGKPGQSAPVSDSAPPSSPQVQMNSLLGYGGSRSYASVDNGLRSLSESYMKAQHKGISGLMTSSYSNQYDVSTDELVQAVINVRNTFEDYQQQEKNNRSIAQKIREEVLAGVNKSSRNTELKNKKLFLIDMIETLFDHICNNKNLSPTAVHLFRRLTIPVIHLSLVDDGFIDNHNHPARLFLEDFADAALGISDDQDSQNNPLYLKLHKIIELASQEDNINSSFFMELHDDLKRFIQYRKQQANIKSPTSRSQIEKKINAIILYHTRNREVPDNLLMILNKVWKKVMLNTWFDDNYNDDDWEKSKAFIGTLINSIQPVNSGIEYQRRERLLPVLRQEFEDGLIQINLPFEQKVKLLKYLDMLHKKALSTGQEPGSSTPAASSAPEPEHAHTAETSFDEDSEEIEITNDLIDEIEARAEQQAAVMANELNEPAAASHAEVQLISTDDLGSEVQTNDTAIRQPEKPTPADMRISVTDYELIRLATQGYKLPPEPDDQYSKMVQQLDVEDWIEFRFDTRLSRAKITWISEDKTQFNCLTQNNHVVEMPLNVLSHSFRNNIATVIMHHSIIKDAIQETAETLLPSPA